ncbi:MAG: endonuclease/exonuclease/phosphatase family protein [Chitinophagales bacterium]
MKKYSLFIACLFLIFSARAESFVYFQNNTSLDLNISTHSTLGSSYWVENFSGNFEAWKLQNKIFEVNRNTGITNGTDFFLTTTVSSGTDSIELKIKLNGNLIGSDIWHAAAGNAFAHTWQNDYSFYSEEFVLNADTFILTYRSDLPPGNIYANFYYVLQEKHPYQVNEAELLDSNILNILAYNIFMLTPPIGSSEEYIRAGILHKYVKNYDALILSEAFYNDARNDLLIPLLSPEYPYQTAVVNGSAVEDGGVMIFSRWPIEYEEQLLFSNCDGSDCLSSKGAMYAKINKLGKKHHLFGTHTQAWADPTSIAVRLEQLGELHQFIANKNIPNSEAVIIGGDLNVNKSNTNQSLEYLPMLDTLNAEEPNYIGFSETYDPNYSTYASGAVSEYLDYVLLEKDYLCAFEYTNEAKIFRHTEQIAALWDNNSLDLDLSDHFPVHGRFVFPEVTISLAKDSLCFEENTLMYAESNVDLDFQWYRNDTLLAGEQNDTIYIVAQNANYYCKATNSSCIDLNTDTIAVFVYPKINAPVISRNQNEISSSVSTGIQWYFNGNIMPGETNASIFTCEAGTYYCTTTVGECTSEASNTVTFSNNTPSISLYGNVAVSSVENGNQWYNSQGEILNETNDTLILCDNDDYFVIATINGCISDTTNTVSDYNVYTMHEIYWLSDTIFSDISSSNIWYFNDSLMPNETSNFIIPQNDGVYSNAINTNCGLKFSNELIVKNSNINAVLVEDIFVYPNPVFGNKINISLENFGAQIIHLKLIDLNGKLVFQKQLRKEELKGISLPFNLNGIYFVLIESKNKKFIQKVRIVN